jgi:hypothetical protein
MENEHDMDLKHLLQSYTVEGASDELLERIVTRAANTKVLGFRQKPNYPFMLRNAAMAAVVAVIGFFCGSVTLSGANTIALQRPSISSTVINKVILGPKNYSEIPL